MYGIYRVLTYVSTPLLNGLLKKRLNKGKEDPQRFQEKKAITQIGRPSVKLIWLHAASVGEAQSALIVIDQILSLYPAYNILVTTGTITSAEMMAKKLPNKAIHQFAPLDHPQWVKRFLNHWSPDFAIWMESELWPNMLHEVKARNIPAVLLNAHMSDKSYGTWKKIPLMPKTLLKTFSQILCQTQKDKERFEGLGAQNVLVTDNLKYSAKPLPFNQEDSEHLENVTKGRKLWLYASTHKGEEEIACKTHQNLKEKHPNLLTIIVPRHPERRDEIAETCKAVTYKFRGKKKQLPEKEDEIYIADTLGELGLFYNLVPIACIGRSFSDDGGGGHNPIEAAQYGCATLHGPNVQNLQDIFDDMQNQNACTKLDNFEQLIEALDTLFSKEDKLLTLQNAAKEFSRKKTSVINTVMAQLKPALDTV